MVLRPQSIACHTVISSEPSMRVKPTVVVLYAVAVTSRTYVSPVANTFTGMLSVAPDNYTKKI